MNGIMACVVSDPLRHPYVGLLKSDFGLIVGDGAVDAMATQNTPGEAMYVASSSHVVSESILVAFLDGGECFPVRFDLPEERLSGFTYICQHNCELFAIPTNMLMDRFESYRKQAMVEARANALKSMMNIHECLLSGEFTKGKTDPDLVAIANTSPQGNGYWRCTEKIHMSSSNAVVPAEFLWREFLLYKPIRARAGGGAEEEGGSGYAVATSPRTSSPRPPTQEGQHSADGGGTTFSPRRPTSPTQMEEGQHSAGFFGTQTSSDEDHSSTSSEESEHESESFRQHGRGPRPHRRGPRRRTTPPRSQAADHTAAEDEATPPRSQAVDHTSSSEESGQESFLDEATPPRSQAADHNPSSSSEESGQESFLDEEPRTQAADVSETSPSKRADDTALRRRVPPRNMETSSTSSSTWRPAGDHSAPFNNKKCRVPDTTFRATEGEHGMASVSVKSKFRSAKSTFRSASTANPVKTFAVAFSKKSSDVHNIMTRTDTEEAKLYRELLEIWIIHPRYPPKILWDVVAGMKIFRILRRGQLIHSPNLPPPHDLVSYAYGRYYSVI